MRMLLLHVEKLLRKERREAAPVRRDIFFAVPQHLENNGPMLRESARVEDKEEQAMNKASVWIEHFRHPLVLAGFGLLLLFALIRAFRRGTPRSDAGKLIHLLALLVMSGIVYWNKDNSGIALPVFVTLLDVAANGALAWKERSAEPDDSGGMQQYEEELKNLRQQILDLQASGSMADDKQRQLLEAQLQAVQEHLADIRESWKEEQLRRKAADEALEQMKCQMPDARIEKAQASLRQNDTKAAKETFAEVRKQAGKAAALAAHHEGKLAEGEVNYAEAMELYRTAVLLEKDNPDYLLAAGKMARKLAEYKQAQEWLERLLELREKEGKNDAALGDTLHELALLHKDLGQYAAAEPLYLRALSIREEALGKDHPDIARILNNLAMLYRSQNRYIEAEPLYLRSLSIKEHVLGKEHPDVGNSLNNLAFLYQKQNRYEEAEPLYLRSLTIREHSLGKEHPDVAQSLNNIAELYRLQGRYVEAEPLLHRALHIREDKLGKDHSDVSITLCTLAKLYRDQGRYAEAEPLFQRALSILQAKLPAGHSRISGCQKDYDEMKENMAGM